MSRGTVISLCDISGVMVKPWLDAGYDAILVDPQHGTTRVEPYMADDGTVVHRTLIADTVEGALPALALAIAHNNVVFVAGFPPCDDLAVSGARWFGEKFQKDDLFQVKAVFVAQQCKLVGALSGAPYFVENPRSQLARVFGPAEHTFHPYEFTGYEPTDNYVKLTCLWTGNDFVMPAPWRDLTLGEPDDRIHKAAPGEDRANFRSKTPAGFARAVFEANRR